jgi:hypothetical protein
MRPHTRASALCCGRKVRLVVFPVQRVDPRRLHPGWPAGSSLQFWATLEVIGPRQVCVRRIAASEVLQVEREDGAIWSN